MRTVVAAPATGTTHRRREAVGGWLREPEGRPRKGWRLAAYLVLVLTAMGAAAALGGGSTAANVAAHGGVAIVVLVVTYVFQRRVDRRAWSVIGLSRGGLRQAAAGFAGGAGSVLAVFAVAWALGWARVLGTELGERGPGAVLALLLAGLFMYATSAFVQELIFRGYALQTLAQGWPVRRAALVSSLIFAVLHLPGVPSPLFALVVIADVMLMAVFFVLTRLATAGLWLAIGFHTAWNWVMDSVLSLDTDAAADFGDALVHVRLDAPGAGLGPGGGIELLYLVNSAALVTGYWLLVRRRQVRTREG
ncbi:MAG TPA: CPBP family intramembrane glutamic endopeptidase [Catenuloplanes sp.]|jgi:hypothetical protein